MRRIVAALCAAAAGVLLARGAAADGFPSRPVTIIVPFSAGGPTDTIVRVIGERMSRALGQPVVIENLPGAAGTIAAARVARSTPDGYTVDIATWSTHIVSPVIYQTSYDVLRDFAPVALLTQTPLLLVGRKALPPDDLRGMVAWLKDKPEPALQGGAGGTDQVAGYLFQQQTATRLQYVPYRGLTLALQDILAGRIDLMFDQPSDALQQVRSGNIKAYGVTAKEHLAIAPEIPTVDEAGLPGIHIMPWHSLWVPKGTPNDVVAKLNGAVMDALADPGVRKRLGDVGQEVVAPERQTPQALAAYYQAETDKWWPIIKAAGLKPE